MKKESFKLSAGLTLMFLMGVVMSGVLASAPNAFAENDAGVAGCNAIQVDPAMSLEAQQAVCGNAEQFPSSSCAASGNGTCSAPKTDGTLMDGNHCICLSQALEAAV